MSCFKESTEKPKTNFLKETVENTRLNNAALNKMKTTQRQCVNYDFVAPLGFDPKRNTEITISDLYSNEERDYSDENTSENEKFRSTILQLFQFRSQQKKLVIMRARRKKLNIRSADDLLHIRIGNLGWCKFGHCKNQLREIDCLCCKEVDAMLNSPARILDRKGSISQSSFCGQLPDYQ